ncbi:hypothetical protein FOBRF1_013430 [Fusarium oxysporum]
MQDEDCLHLTVTASVEALTDGKKRPVMVFLHGGAYVSGGGDLDAYSPVGLAQRGLVMVNITHRLGLFGYLPIHDRAPANLGLYDQIMALEWIQGNIADFGGDPNRVTLFGESAGADSIFCLMIAEGTRHLFHQAILQSAPLGVRMMDREQMIQALGALAHHRLASSEAPRTSDEMLLLQVELLMEAKKHPSGLMAFGPSLGHAPLPPLSEVSHKIQLAAKQTNLFIGYTTHEGAPFARMNDTLRSYFDLPLVGWLIERLLYAKTTEVPSLTLPPLSTTTQEEDIIITNAISGSSFASRDPNSLSGLTNFGASGNAEFHQGGCHHADGSLDDGCAALSANGDVTKRSFFTSFASIFQTVRSVQRKKYTIQFFYLIHSAGSQGCVASAAFGNTEFYSQHAYSSGPSWARVLRQVEALSDLPTFAISLTCSGGGVSPILVDSIFISDQVTAETIDNFKLELGGSPPIDPLETTTAIRAQESPVLTTGPGRSTSTDGLESTSAEKPNSTSSLEVTSSAATEANPTSSYPKTSGAA